ncbi:hypothetical protein BD413DRAFT_494677 [Trametes elegans]|nr:hypothetical protein BD413DRAFT_494677 [Trametes elegans]
MNAPHVDFMPMIGPLVRLSRELSISLTNVFMVVVLRKLVELNFPSDQLKIRIIVWGMFVLELVQTATTTHQAWYYGVSSWNNPAALATFPWSATTVPTMAGIRGFASPGRFSQPDDIDPLQSPRLRSCSMPGGYRPCPPTGSSRAWQSSSCCDCRGVDRYQFAAFLTPTKLKALHPEFEVWHLPLWVASSFVTDVLIAACMLWILYNAKNRTVWARSSNIIGRLIGITVGTGLAIAICGALTLALFATTKGSSFQYLPAAYIWGKLYSNSVMVSLNSRRSTTGSAPNTAGATDAESYPLSIHVSHQVFRRGDDNRSAITGGQSWNEVACGTGTDAAITYYLQRKSTSSAPGASGKVPLTITVDSRPPEHDSDLYALSKEDQGIAH